MRKFSHYSETTLKLNKFIDSRFEIEVLASCKSLLLTSNLIFKISLSLTMNVSNKIQRAFESLMHLISFHEFKQFRDKKIENSISFVGPKQL